MKFTTLDFAVLGGFYAVILAFSIWKGRRENTSADYFLGGRSLPWWLIGISIVAANISTEQMVGMAGQGAGGVGLAVSAWQLVGSVGIVLIAFTLLPRFLRAGIYTIPEYLEYRYNATARTLMAVSMVVIYTTVMLSAVFYSGGLTLKTIFGVELEHAIWGLGLVAAIYTTWGGLKALAWADLFQGLALLGGGLLIFFLGLRACGGWESFATANADRLHMVLPADHKELPWTGVFSGMWIVLLYYCGLNQFIVQRNLAARTMRDGQLGTIFAGALWLLVPFAIVMPGIMSWTLYRPQLAVAADEANAHSLARLGGAQPAAGEPEFLLLSPDADWTARHPGQAAEIDLYNGKVRADAATRNVTPGEQKVIGYKADAAFPTMVTSLVPQGLRGMILAAIVGAVVSTLAALMNSTSTIFTMDIYHRLIDRQASQKSLVFVGRVVTVVSLVIGCLLAPQLNNPNLKGVFNFIQTFQGYIWPGVAAAFVFGMLVPTAPPAAGVAALVCGPLIYHFFQVTVDGDKLNFLLQVALTFQLVIFIMGLITFWKPLAEPKTLPVREGMEMKTEPFVVWCGIAVIAGVAAFWIYFW